MALSIVEFFQKANPSQKELFKEITLTAEQEMSAKGEELTKIRSQMKEYLVKAVEIGMGDLRAVQNTYEHYVGKPMPKN